MAKKVNEYIHFLGNTPESVMSVSEKNFRKYMLAKIEELGTYANMNTENFKENFYVSEIPSFSEYGMGTITLYCYKKVTNQNDENSLNLIYFMAHPRDDIFLRKAATSIIDLKSRTFEHHRFNKPDCLFWEINIIHQKMTGVLPYHLFDPKECDNLTTEVIKKDFNIDSLRHNTVYEIHDTIEKSKNEKEYWYQKPDMMWEINPVANYENNLNRRWPDLNLDAKNMSQEEIGQLKEILIKKASEIEDIESLFKTIDLVHYKNEYEKAYGNKITPHKMLINTLKKQN